MKKTTNWNYERFRTSIRLLDYDETIVPPHPHSAGLAMVYPIEEDAIPMPILSIPNTTIPVVYPWENTALATLASQLYQLAIMGGFTGTSDDFLQHFANFVSDKQIIFDTFENFPQYGREDKLYFDTNENILYYWEEDYIPVNAMLIAGTTIIGGGA